MESMSISNISNPADPRENLLIEHTVILLEAVCLIVKDAIVLVL